MEEETKQKKADTLSAIKNNKVKTIKKPRRTTSMYKSNGVLKARAAEPLKSIEDIKSVMDYFLNSDQQFKYRNYLMFVLGIHVGRRAGDILRFKVGDVYDFNSRQVVPKIYIIEEKTRKPVYLYLNEQVRNAVELYLSNKYKYEDINSDDWLFYSRKKDKDGNHKVSVSSAWKILNDAAKDLKLEVHMGTHTMRKIFGYKVYNECPNTKEALSTLQDMFNHSSQKMTLNYIGITEESKQQIMLNLNY